MNLQELANETLVEKNRRLLRAKCPHIEIYESTVYGPHGIFANAFCLECGQAIPPAHRGGEA